MITQREAILVLNAGFRRMEFSLYDASIESLDLIAAGRLDARGDRLALETVDSAGSPLACGPLILPESREFSHAWALDRIFDCLHDRYGEYLTLVAIAHQVTHGGIDHTQPAIIDNAVLESLEQLIPLAPLDQPHNLAAIRAAMRCRPDLPHVACFDTAFHRLRPAVAERLALPVELHRAGFRRWGFHGIACESFASTFARIAPQAALGRVISVQLGQKISLCAMKGGHSIETTAGFSPLDSLPTATSCGSLDPAVVLALLRTQSTGSVESLLHERSGLLGISGISGDPEVLLASPLAAAAEALDLLVYHISREIGALAAALGGLDALAFTGTIGLSSAPLRIRICRAAAWLGVTILNSANDGGERCISPPGRSPSVWIIPTDESRVVASHARRIVSLLPRAVAFPRGSRHDRAAQN